MRRSFAKPTETELTTVFGMNKRAYAVYAELAFKELERQILITAIARSESEDSSIEAAICASVGDLLQSGSEPQQIT